MGVSVLSVLLRKMGVPVLPVLGSVLGSFVLLRFFPSKPGTDPYSAGQILQ